MTHRVCFLMAVLLATPWAGGLTCASRYGPELEERAHRIEAQLIAPCCWTQPVSQHYSEAATRIRTEVREMLAAGRSEQEILDLYVERYGERILASPRARGFNRFAYILPWAFFILGAVALVLILRHWSTHPAPAGGENLRSTTVDRKMSDRIEAEMREFE